MKDEGLGLMDEREEAKLIFEAVHALGIDVPVMASRIVGDDPVGSLRVELHLYGGQVKVYTPPDTAGAAADGDCAAVQLLAPPEKPVSSTAAIKNIADYNHPAVRDLEGMGLVALRDLARQWKITGWNKLGKAKLIEALRMSTFVRKARV